MLPSQMTVAQADTIVFDKTGTLTHACPVMARVVPFSGRSEKEMLPPAASAMLHNASTLGVSLRSMTNLLPEKQA